jgi:ankyrin repeat protein
LRRYVMAAEPDDVAAARDNAQHSPLNMAAFHGNPEAVELLLAAGADASNPDTSG